jgi:hypothetical protein
MWSSRNCAVVKLRHRAYTKPMIVKAATRIAGTSVKNTSTAMYTSRPVGTKSSSQSSHVGPGTGTRTRAL